MNNPLLEARGLVASAREALRRGDKASARQLGEQAAYLAPDMEDAWLVLAASDPDPHDALAYARKALELNPHSTRAHRAVEWASARLPAEGPTSPVPAAARQLEATAPQPKQAYQTAVAMPALRPGRRSWLLPAVLGGAGILFLGMIALLVLFVKPPALAFIMDGLRPPAAAQETLWAPADIAKPEATPIPGGAFDVEQGDPAAAAVPTRPASTAAPTQTTPPEATATFSPAVTEESTVLPAATETPGSMVMEIVEDTATNIAPTPGISAGDGVRWIDVDLTNQMVYAYEGDTVINSFLVSTGTWLTPTVTGRHKIYIKNRVQDMSGPGYYLRDVPYVMFFSGDYGLHGTYWHNNFGTPMSRGCVNLTIDDAAWLFSWASIGTVVNVHY